MFRGISLLSKRGFLQKKDKFRRGFLFSPLLLIPLFLVIISGFLIKSIQEEFLVSNYLNHILTGFVGYLLAFFIPPDMPSKQYEIFGKGGGQTLAKENDLPLLAKIPIEIPLVDESNKGLPISISQPNKVSSIAFSNLALLIKNQFVNK